MLEGGGEREERFAEIAPLPRPSLATPPRYTMGMTAVA